MTVPPTKPPGQYVRHHSTDRFRKGEALIADTGYHRRDPELAAVRTYP
ncbi:MAG: hypothetical protein ABI806_05565 [Candidatus Solibacter sp.]